MNIAAYKIDRFKLVRKRSGIHNADPVGEDVNFVLNRKIIAGVGKTVDHSLSHRIDRNFRNLHPVDPVALHFDPPADIFYDIPDSSVNQLKYIAFS